MPKDARRGKRENKKKEKTTQNYLDEKRWVLRALEKHGMLAALRMEMGRAFHCLGPATEKAQSPACLDVLFTTYLGALEERRE